MMITRGIVLAVVVVIVAVGSAVARDDMLSPMEQLGKDGGNAELASQVVATGPIRTNLPLFRHEKRLRQNSAVTACGKAPFE